MLAFEPMMFLVIIGGLMVSLVSLLNHGGPFAWIFAFVSLFSSLVIINFVLFSRKELLKVFAHKYGLIIAITLGIVLGGTGVISVIKLLKA